MAQQGIISFPYLAVFALFSFWDTQSWRYLHGLGSESLDLEVPHNNANSNTHCFEEHKEQSN